jgi:hypothetical protein
VRSLGNARAVKKNAARRETQLKSLKLLNNWDIAFESPSDSLASGIVLWDVYIYHPQIAFH